jgi:hypothetical protein
MGKHMYQNQLDWGNDTDERSDRKRHAILDYMLKETFFLDIQDPKHEFLQVLIKGLLRYSPTDRFGFEEVNRWLANDKTLVVNDHIDEETKKNSDEYWNPFNFEGVKYVDDQSLDQTFATNWEQAKKYLYRGTVKETFASLNQYLSIIADDIVNKIAPTARQLSLGIV